MYPCNSALIAKTRKAARATASSVATSNRDVVTAPSVSHSDAIRAILQDASLAARAGFRVVCQEASVHAPLQRVLPGASAAVAGEAEKRRAGEAPGRGLEGALQRREK